MSIMTVTLNPCIDKTITINGFLYGGLNLVDLSRADPGGKGINVARVLKKSGEDAFCTGIIACDGGQIIKECLEYEGIISDFAECEGKIRTNIKLFDSESKVTTEINEKGFSAGKQTLSEFAELYESNLPSAEVVAISGSAAPGIPADTYKMLIKKANSLGIKTVLDASGELFRQGTEAVPFAVKPNIHELEEYLGANIKTEAEIKSAATVLLNKGISLVCVSMGADGAVFAGKEGFIKTTPFNSDIKSTVGAGDSMVAAIAYAIKNGLYLEQTARLATAAGTLTSCLEGTNLCSLKDAQKMCDAIKVFEY